MDSAKVSPIHIATLEEVYEVAHEFGAEIFLWNVALDQRPHLAEQLRAGTPPHKQGSKTTVRCLPPKESREGGTQSKTPTPHEELAMNAPIDTASERSTILAVDPG
ncbi:MAG TPA: hypothetical protein VKI65_19690 [Gemmataceae bacterium]|nr:hypothetical protein [Gemmataceae bacterium]